MGRLTKLLLVFFAALVGIFAIGAVIFWLFFDANDFRDDLEQVVEDATGRELTIAGDVGLKIIPWLAVSVSDVTVGNAPGFDGEDFASFERAELSVRFWPLVLRREITVGKAEIDGLRVQLQVNKRNESNWSGLLAAEEVEGEPDAEAGGGSFEMSAANIRNATITYADEHAGGSYSLRDANLSIGRITSDGASGKVAIGKFSLEGVVEGIAESPGTMSFGTAGIEVDSIAQIASLQPIEISILGLDIRGEVQPISYADAIEPQAAISIAEFSPRSLMTVFGVEPPETADPSALSRVSLSANAQLRQNDIRLTDIVITLDDTTFKGKLSVPLNEGAYSLDLVGDVIDLNRYMAPPSEAAASDAGEEAPVEIPADLIKTLNARGSLRFTSVMMGSLPLENVVLELNASGGRMRIHPITANLFGGSYDGNVLVDASGATTVLSVDETVEGVDLGKLVLAMFEQQNITGSIKGNFKLTGRGNDMGAVQRSLGGTMSFELKDGTYEGTDVWYELRRARALLKEETPPEPVLPARTKFSAVKATGVVKDGIMQNEDFVADLPFMQLTGKGSVNIPEGTVDYGLRARIFSKPEAMGAATQDEIDDLTKTVIPIKVMGPLAEPKFTPDVEELLRQRVEDEIRDALKDKLKDIFD
jgi:AsmA protein